MEEVLSKMDPEKRIAFINAALTEFGNNSYAKASTNVIVKNAGISKGLLYHYFKNKKELYEYLEKFLFEKYAADVLSHIDFTKGDILERIASVAKYKMETFKIYPGIVVFAKGFYAGKDMEEIKALFDRYTPNYYNKFYQTNIDYTLFKEGVDIPRALKMTQWIIEKYSEEKIMMWEKSGDLNMEDYYGELNGYLDTIRSMFYKEA